MTRKDYELLAAALGTAMRQGDTEPQRIGAERAAMRVADALSRDNTRFNRDRFLIAVDEEANRG